jgi:5-methyltetrahydrofolate--homocysteine methyltransferase
MIGLSGLITPSLDEMTEIVKLLRKNNINIPIMVGGATTSAQHTAVKIAPHYKGIVIQVPDASKSVMVANSLVDKNLKLRNDFFNEVLENQNELRENYLKNLEERKFKQFKQNENFNLLNKKWENFKIEKPQFFGKKIEKDIDINDEIINLINWEAFFSVYQIKFKYPFKSFPSIFNDPKYGQQAKKLYDDAINLLNLIKKNKYLKINSLFGFYKAYSDNNDVILYEEETEIKEKTKFHFLRQQILKETEDEEDEINKGYKCLSDFILPKQIKQQKKNLEDYLGFFIISVFGTEELIKKEYNNDIYNSLMIKAISDRLVEAYSEYLHTKIRKDYWGYSKNEKEMNLEQLYEFTYQGIRPAIGYPSIPDHSEKLVLWELTNADIEICVELTSNLNMYPASSICGLYFGNEKSKYFNVGLINKDQLENYSKRKLKNEKEIENLIQQNVGYF